MRFTAQIERFFALFGRENVLVNTFDDLVADPATMYTKILAFLAVDPAFTTAFGVINSNKVVRSQLLRAFTLDPPRHLERAVKLTLPNWLRNEAWRWLGRINTRFVPRPEPKAALVARLKREFAGEVEGLSNLLSRDLTAWSR